MPVEKPTVFPTKALCAPLQFADALTLAKLQGVGSVAFSKASVAYISFINKKSVT